MLGFVADRPQLDAIRLRVPVLRTQASHRQLRRAVGILHPVRRFLRRSAQIVQRDLRIEAEFSGEVHEFVDAEIVWLPLVPDRRPALRPPVAIADAVLPMIRVGEAAARIPHNWDLEGFHCRHHVGSHAAQIVGGHQGNGIHPKYPSALSRNPDSPVVGVLGSGEFSRIPAPALGDAGKLLSRVGGLAQTVELHPGGSGSAPLQVPIEGIPAAFGEVQPGLINAGVIGTVAVNLHRLCRSAAIVFVTVDAVAAVRRAPVHQFLVAVRDSFLGNPSGGHAVAVQVAFLEFPVAKHLRPQPAGVEAMLVVHVLFPTAYGAVFVLHVLPEQVLRDGAHRFGGIDRDHHRRWFLRGFAGGCGQRDGGQHDGGRQERFYFL